MEEEKFKPTDMVGPTLVCGIFVGALSSVAFLGLFCFIWQFLGGIFVSYFLRKETVPLKHTLLCGVLFGFFASATEIMIEGFLIGGNMANFVEASIMFIQRMGLPTWFIANANLLYAGTPFVVLMLVTMFSKAVMAGSFGWLGFLFGRKQWR